MKYAINYLSKYSTSKKNLVRIIKNKAKRMKLEENSDLPINKLISSIINELESKKLIDDSNYTASKISFLIKQGKSKNFINSYLIQRGIDKYIINNCLINFEEIQPNWEEESAKIYIKKKLRYTKDNEKKLSKMARAGFDYKICKKLLGLD